MDNPGSRLRSALSDVRPSDGGSADEATRETATEDRPTAEDMAAAEGEETALPLDLAFEILKNERRRMVLEELAAADGEVTLGDLSEAIAARENDKTVPEISSEERKRVYVGLYQAHLPKMDDAGVVRFNKDRGLIAPGEHVDLLERYLGSPTSGAAMEPPAGTVTPRRRERAATTLLLGLLLGLSLGLGTVRGVSVPLLALVLLFAISATLTGRALRRA